MSGEYSDAFLLFLQNYVEKEPLKQVNVIISNDEFDGNNIAINMWAALCAPATEH